MPQKANAFDLVLVDGDHSAAGAMADLQNVWPLVRPDGCVVFHDTNHPAHPELRQVFDSFVAQHRAPHLVNDAGYGLGVAWKR
jgi:predicted O-methyltransferase YrrM